MQTRRGPASPHLAFQSHSQVIDIIGGSDEEGSDDEFAACFGDAQPGGGDEGQAEARPPPTITMATPAPDRVLECPNAAQPMKRRELFHSGRGYLIQ